MKKVRKPSPTESPLLFEISPEPIPETLTALGGVPLLVQAFRSLGLPARVREHVRIKERDRGYDEATMVCNGSRSFPLKFSRCFRSSFAV